MKLGKNMADSLENASGIDAGNTSADQNMDFSLPEVDLAERDLDSSILDQSDTESANVTDTDSIVLGGKFFFINKQKIIL